MLHSFKEGDAKYRDSKTWSLVYYLGEEHPFSHRCLRDLLLGERAQPHGFQEPEAL